MFIFPLSRISVNSIVCRYLCIQVCLASSLRSPRSLQDHNLCSHSSICMFSNMYYVRTCFMTAPHGSINMPFHGRECYGMWPFHERVDVLKYYDFPCERRKWSTDDGVYCLHYWHFCFRSCICYLLTERSFLYLYKQDCKQSNIVWVVYKEVNWCKNVIFIIVGTWNQTFITSRKD